MVDCVHCTVSKKPAAHGEVQVWHAHALTFRKLPAGHTIEEQLAHCVTSDVSVPVQVRLAKKPGGQVVLQAAHLVSSQAVHAAALYLPAPQLAVQKVQVCV